MNAIRVKAHIQSETLHLPQLKPLIGKDVEIIVLESVKAKRRKDQRVKSGWFKRNFGRGWPGKKDDGFEEAVAKWRREDKVREFPD